MNNEITTTKIAIFRKREIRKTIHNNEWWFVVNDVVLALTDSPNVQDYIKKMRKRDNELSKGWGQIATPLVMTTGYLLLGLGYYINCSLICISICLTYCRKNYILFATGINDYAYTTH